MTPKQVQLCDDPPPPKKKKKKSSYHPKNIHFSDNPKNIENQNFEPQNWAEPTCV